LIIGLISGLQYESMKALKRRGNELREKVDELERSNVALRTEMAAREKAEAELLRSRTELARMNRVMQLGELGASIAHEITQPLASIMAEASVARRCLDATPPDPNETRQSLVHIRDSAQRAVDVVARIRALAKKSPIQTTQVDINATITNVLALVRSEIELNRITVRTELKGAVSGVQGDPVQLQQVLLNLVMNAMDAMTASEPRDLLLSTKQACDKVHVLVCDSGCGFEPGTANRLFDAFYTTKAAGMGMGLAICRSIIHSHGGQLSARDNAPCGAIFEFELPLQQASADGA
jgi:C4-dicarboxylate-specific signal transduction histidine kinase